MADSPGRQLLDLIQRELVDAIHDAVAGAVAELTALAVDPDYAGTQFAGRVLEVFTPHDPVLSLLASLTGGTAANQVQVHGWRDTAADAAPHGLAYLVRAGSGVAALTVVPDGDARITLRAAGFTQGQTLSMSLTGDFSIRLSATTTDEIAVAFFPDRPPEIATLTSSDRVEVDFTRTTAGKLLGIEGGPSVLFGAVSVGGYVAATTGGQLDRGGHLKLTGGAVALVPGFLKNLIPIDLAFPLDLDLRASPDAGVALAGSPSLRTRLTGSDAARWLDLAVDIADAAGAPALRLSFQTSLDVTLPGAPVSMHVDGIGLSLPVALKLGAPMLPSPGDVHGLEPNGAGVSLDLPVLSGSGMLAHIGDDLAGALSVKIPPMSASAFGLLSPAHDGNPLSFLVIMGATFPPPGIQVGFGFAISGVGGVVGVNRRIDRDALLRAVTDGTAAQLLFPSDPANAGEAAIHALPAVFPAARGSVVAGPMFQLSWGGRIVTLSAAVLVEAAGQVRITVLGKLVVALPDPEAPLIFLQATFAGIIDPGEPSVMFVASLTGSHIVGAALSGDILMLTRGGSDPTMILSAGGFHPAYRIPRGVPALHRLAMDLSPASWLELRCENYFAVTSNTLQLGARLELVAEVADCGLRGHFAYDALIQYSPFRFIADVSGGITLRAFGETLIGINLAFHLEGPSPYLARGRGSIDLFFFDVSFDFEIGWGSAPAQSGPPPDVGAAVRQALTDPAAWQPRRSNLPGLALTPAAQKALERAEVVDPYGAVTVQQSRVPLGIPLGLFEGIPVPTQRWDLVGGQFGPGEPADHTVEIRTEFAPGQFIPSRSDDEALTAAAFLPLRAGIELYPTAAAGADARPADLLWEERVIAHDIPKPVPGSTGIFGDLHEIEILMTAISTAESGWWQVAKEVVTVRPVPPVTTAFGWSMTAGPGVVADNALEAATAVRGTTGLLAVETWEL